MIKTRLTTPKLHFSQKSLKLYYFNLRGAIPDIKPKLAVEVFIHDRPFKLNYVKPEIIEQRISRGDRIFVAAHQLKPVAYLFAATKDCWVDEIQDWFIVAAGEVYLYDAFTVAEYRGNRIYPFLISSATHFFKELAYSYALIISTASNMQSITAIERTGFKSYETIHFYNLLGFRMWNSNPRSKDVQSRFSNEI